MHREVFLGYSYSNLSSKGKAETVFVLGGKQLAGHGLMEK